MDPGEGGRGLGVGDAALYHEEHCGRDHLNVGGLRVDVDGRRRTCLVVLENGGSVVLLLHLIGVYVGLGCHLVSVDLVSPQGLLVVGELEHDGEEVLEDDDAVARVLLENGADYVQR